MMKTKEDDTSGNKGKEGGSDLSRAATILLLLTGEEATSGTEGTDALS